MALGRRILHWHRISALITTWTVHCLLLFFVLLVVPLLLPVVNVNAFIVQRTQLQLQKRRINSMFNGIVHGHSEIRSKLDLAAFSSVLIPKGRNDNLLKQRKRRRRKSKNVSSITSRNAKTLQDYLSHQQRTVDDILTSFESRQATAGDRLNVVDYALVIDAFANIGDVESAKKVIDTMIARWKIRDNDGPDNYDQEEVVLPNSHCYGGLMKAHINAFTKMNRGGAEKNISQAQQQSKQQSPTLVEECEHVLKEMSELYIQSGKKATMPNAVIYNLLLKAITKEAIHQADESQRNGKDFNNPLLKSFESKYATMNIDSTTVKAKGQVYVNKAIDILTRMEQRHENDHGLKHPKPDSYSYCTVISLLAKCVSDVEGAEFAESFLDKVEPLDTASYNAVILAWSNLGTRYGAERANKLLDKLESSLPTGGDDRGTVIVGIGSNEFTYNTIISAWVKSASIDGEYEYAAEQAEQILRRGINRCKRFQANVVSFSSIIDCWSRSGSLTGSKRAQQLLHEMEYLYSSGDNLAVKPNVITYTSCLVAYARTNTVEGATAANALFQTMKQKYKENNDEDYKVNMVSYFAVIDGWARSNSTEAGQNALHLLNELETTYLQGEKELKPDVRVYARVIAALVKSSTYDAAEKVVQRMEAYATTGDETYALAKPNVVIYNTLINDYARRRQPKRAMNILNQMDRYNSCIKSEGDKVHADEHTLNGMIYALSNGNGKDKARKALKMLERLENSHINGSWDSKASTRSYNMVINACGNSFKQDEKERAQAVDIALNVYAKLVASNHVDTDRFTFISLLKAFGKLMPTNSKRRQKLVSEVFKHCCDVGLVCDDVLENYLLAVSSSSVLPEIMNLMNKTKQNKLSSSMLPPQWTHRARRSRRRRYQ